MGEMGRWGDGEMGRWRLVVRASCSLDTNEHLARSILTSILLALLKLNAPNDQPPITNYQCPIPNAQFPIPFDSIFL
jgi:hypothetical protein